jgi:hypothetical protein
MYYRLSEDWAVDSDTLYHFEGEDTWEYEITGISYLPYQVCISIDQGTLTLCKLEKNYVGLNCDMNFELYSQPIKMEWKSFIKSLF